MTWCGTGTPRAMRGLVVLCSLIAAGACGQDDSASRAIRGHDAAQSHADRGAEDGTAADDASLWAAYMLARQRAASPDYYVWPDGPYLVADNVHHRFTTTFSSEGFMLSERVAPGETPTWEASIAVDGYGCPNALSPLGAAGPTAANAAQRNRVEQVHGALEAWYLNGPLGLEQGFEVTEPPGCLAEVGKLTIAMTVDGLTPHLGAGGEVLLIETADRNVVLRYHGLHVTDATGNVLPAELGVDGARLLIEVGAAGATFPLAVDPLWSEQPKLTASDAAAGDRFGIAVSVSGDTALIGADGDDDGALSSGAAYVFVRSGNSWSQQAKLTASDPKMAHVFGGSVSVSGDIALVGAWRDDHAGSDSGAAYVFVRSGTSWTEEAKLTASDAGAGDWFGDSVSVSGDTALVGAARNDDAGSDSGSAYVFVRSGTNWTEEAKLTASDAAAVDVFGWSVSVSGDTALVGASGATVSGSAYVFVRSGTSWTEEAKLTASDAAAGDQFGESVSLSGDTALVAAWRDSDAGSESGSAYVFIRSGTNWTEQAKLTASDAAAGDRFGHSVSVSGDTAVIGAYFDVDAGPASGSAYVFVRNGTSWTEDAKLTASDAAAEDRFGLSVSVSGDTALVGAYLDDDAGGDSGSAYLFEVAVEDCTNGIDDDGDGAVDCNDPDCDAQSCDDGNVCTTGEICTFATASCDGGASMPAMTDCDDGLHCNGADTCNASGICANHAGDPCPDDGQFCTGVESCNETTDACEATGDPCLDDALRCDDATDACEATGGAGGSTRGNGSGGNMAGAGGSAFAAPPAATEADGGCSCSLPGRRRSPSQASWLIVLLSLGLAVRRTGNDRLRHRERPPERHRR